VKGRPLRFLATVMAGWVGLRVVLLWPQSPGLPALIGAVAPPLAAAERPDGWGLPLARPDSTRRLATLPAPAPALPTAPEAGSADHHVAIAPAALVGFGPELVQDDAEPVAAMAEAPARLPPPLVPTPPPAAPRRLAGSLWAIGRGGGAGQALPGGQLGASQAGARLTYALDSDRRVALAGRVSAPLRGRGAEVAVGVEWRPIDAPVRLIAEHRLALDGGRRGPTVLAVAGLPPTPFAGWTLEAYGQAGAIARGRGMAFADGSARITRIVAGRSGPDLGLGGWGGAQPGSARLDLGPTLGIALPIGRQRLRITADWRVRVAGRARPNSGPALSIGTDF